MALTLTVAELAAALRLGDSPEETAQVTRLLTLSALVVEKFAPEAPPEVQAEAGIRIAGYIFDSPSSPAGTAHAAILRNSGAGSLMAPYRVHRAGNVAEAGR